MRGAGVVIDDVTVRFGDTYALENASLELEPERVHALLGPSGGGKTTLLRVLAGLVTPTSGRVHLDGVDVTDLPTERRGMVLVHQEHLLFPQMSVLANVSFPARARGESRQVAEGEARAALAQVKLEQHEARMPHALSGGERQRVALARALMAKPRVLLLDEPLSALDATLRDEMRELILSLHAASGLTMLVVTHDQREASSLAHCVSVIDAGRILQTDAPTRLYLAPASETVARFLGATNFFDTVVDGLTARTSLGDLSLAAVSQSGAARLCIWPQDIGLGPGENPLTGTVRRLTFTGAEQRARLALSGGELEVSAPRWASLAVGQQVDVHLPPKRIVVLPRALTTARIQGAAR